MPAGQELTVRVNDGGVRVAAGYVTDPREVLPVRSRLHPPQEPLFPCAHVPEPPAAPVAAGEEISLAREHDHVLVTHGTLHGWRQQLLRKACPNLSR
eukprot:746725-Hanusia_phi.AAC.3